MSNVVSSIVIGPAPYIGAIADRPRIGALRFQRMLVELVVEDGRGPIFINKRSGAPLSNNGALDAAATLTRAEPTVHGFRSAFWDWAAEQTEFPREVAEAALAHVLEDKVEAANRRTDLFE